MLHLYVPDVDAVYARALDAGGISLSEPTDEFYGDRRAGDCGRVKEPVRGSPRTSRMSSPTSWSGARGSSASSVVSSDTRYRYWPPGPARNTWATVPASAVNMAAATGATMAATGIRVGSVPVSITGSAMARIVATVQITSVATDSPTQMGCQLRRPRSRAIANRKITVPTPPQNQAVIAATGRCSCSEPDTRSGEKGSLADRDPDPADPDRSPQVHDRSAVAA